MAASHTTRAAFLSALLRNCTTVLNRDTSVKEDMIFLTASLSAEEASASTGTSEARRAGSREAPKSAGRDIGWIDCRQMVWVSGEKIQGRVKRRTFSRAQRAPVSEEGMLSHARVNSNSVHGAAKGAGVAADIACAGGGAGAGVDTCVRVGSFGGSATADGGTSRVLNTVSFPDVRKIPPPTRPADFASRTSLASLNEVSVGFGTAGAGGTGVDFPSGGGGGGVEGVSETRRELMGFSRRSLSSLVGRVTTGV
jgi:hypothetical protein